MRRFWFGMGLLCFGCGDDGASTTASETDATQTGGPTTEPTTGPSTSSATETGDPSTSGPDPDGSSSGMGTEPETDSTTGLPNTAPELVDDFYLTNTLATDLAVDATTGVLANDTDPDGDTLTIETFDVESEAGGTVDMMDDGSFTYTPPDAYFGEDAFTYTATDGAGGMGTARVRIMVAPTLEPLQTVTDGVGGFAIDAAAAGDYFGASVRGTGDVNGDGLLDVVVGADRDEEDLRAAYVVFGKVDTYVVDAGNLAAGGFVIEGEAAISGAGHSVAVIGDVNGDGLADIAVGTEQSAGRAYVVFGKADTATVALADVAAGTGGFAIENGADALTDLGSAVAAAGDVNGDGLADVIVGAPATDPGGLAGGGVAYVVFGKTDTALVDVSALGTAGFAIASSTANAAFGTSVDGAGDVDGDGLDDVIVGAPHSTSSRGLGAVVRGKNTDTDTVTVADLTAGSGGFVILGDAPLDELGHSVAGVGDVNGDGLADVALGAPGVDIDDGGQRGRAYVVLGKTDTASVDVTDVVSGTGGFSLDGEANFDLAGWSVGGGSDLNGDGLSDVLVGAYSADFAAGTAGRAYVIFGRDDTTPIALADIALGMGGFALDGEAQFASAGWAVDGVDDVNGDGFGDLIVSSPRYSNYTGRAHVVFGGDFLGVVDLVGTPQNDVLEGDAGANAVVAGRGDDELIGGGGADILYAGPGNDVIIVSGGDFLRIDGGTGDDTLRLEGDGEALDLTNVYELSVRGIETIDLGDMGDNQLFMALRDVRAMSPDSNTLRVTGDMGDTAVIDLAGGSFVDQGSAGGFTTYADGVLTLVVSDEIEAFVQL